MNPGASRLRPMAFPGLIRSFYFFFFNPGNTSIWSAILSQALYPPEVVNVVGYLAPDDWGGGGPTGLGFLAGASGAGPGRDLQRRGPALPQPLSHPLPGPALAGASAPTHAGRRRRSPRPFLRPKPPRPALLPSALLPQVAFPLRPSCRAPTPTALPLSASSKCDLFPPSVEEWTVPFPSLWGLNSCCQQFLFAPNSIGH